MTQVKFNNEKWWVLHQESWVEINEKDWEKIKILSQVNEVRQSGVDKEFDYKWQPTHDQIYSLSNEVEFEIKKIPNTDFANPELFPSKKVAHLKNIEPKHSIQITKSMTICNGKINSGGICELCCQPAQSSSGYCIRIVERSEEVREEPQTDSDKLRLLAAWFDINDPKLNFSGDSVQKDLRRIADNLGKDSQSEIESLKAHIKQLELTLSGKTFFDEKEVMQSRINDLEQQRETLIAKLMNAEDKVKELSPKEEEQDKHWATAYYMMDLKGVSDELKSKFTIIKKT